MIENAESTNLENINPQLIEFDDNNPRGETIQQIEEDDSFSELKKSVRNYGVLVPLIAQRIQQKKKPFKLVDGERRLRAALAEKKKTVPVHIIDGSEGNARILAYNIHMLRKQWEKKSELTAIKEIRDEILIEMPDISETELFSKLREITSHKPHELKDLLILLKYDSKIIKKFQDGTILMSHLIQIDTSFLSPFKREFPRVYDGYGDTNLRNILVTKAENGRIGNTRFLMDNVLKYFVNPPNKTKLRNAIKKFLDNPEAHVDIIVKAMDNTPKTSANSKQTQKKKKTKTKKKATTKSTGNEFQYALINITPNHLTRINDIRPKFVQIAKKFTDEEAEYVKEAVFCLESHCFKAATLMIWSSGISRILKYIEKNLVDYNKCSKEMHDNPKSFYKHFSRVFMTHATDINDVRENCNDRQLLCYICYKNFITIPEFKKLKNNYDTRNDCAHPTSIMLNPNEILVIFESVFHLILNNSKVK